MRYIFLCTGSTLGFSGMRCSSPRPLSGGTLAGKSSGNTSAYSYSSVNSSWETSSLADKICGTAPDGNPGREYSTSYMNNNGDPLFFNHTSNFGIVEIDFPFTLYPFQITLSPSILFTLSTIDKLEHSKILPIKIVLFIYKI